MTSFELLISDQHRYLGLDQSFHGRVEVNIRLLSFDRHHQTVPHGVVISLLLNESFPPPQCGIDTKHSPTRQFGCSASPDVRVERTAMPCLSTEQPVRI